MSKQKDNASEDASRIAGNVSLDLKEFIALQFKDIMANKTGIGFAQSVGMKFALMEISWLKKPEEPERMEARVVMEGFVDDDMANSWGNLHGGCTAYLADICTTMALLTFDMLTDGYRGSVSQSLNVMYHSPASIGDKVRIVNTTMTVGSRAMSARCEIWNETHHRLVASAVHAKMVPSMPKQKAQL